MKTKATAAGSCQACGRVQKLPDGTLAKHGYTTRWGFFEGTCVGTGHKPYEQDCSLIQRFIDSATKSRADVLARIAELAKPATEPKAWFSEYVPAKRRGEHSRYQEREVALLWSPAGESVDYETGKTRQRLDIYWFDLEGKREPAFRHSVNGWTVLEVADNMNKRFIENTLQPIVKRLTEYIEWQQKRVTDWKLAPLRDLKEVQ